MCFLSVGAGCSPGKVTHSDGSGLMRIYTPSVISALQRHLASTDPELGGPLENLVLSSSNLTLLQIHHVLSLHVLHSLPPGCSSRQSILSLGVPGPAGLHHGGSVGGPNHSPDRHGHLGCITGYRLVHCGPEPGTESRLGRR